VVTSAKRDLGELQRVLERWLVTQLGEQLGDQIRPDSVTVGAMVVPKAGYSNETVLARARWQERSGEERERSFVLRIQPADHQVYVEPDALRQARVMQALAGQVPVPTVWFIEPDPSLLGAPFFLMDLVAGRIPSDVPSWHKRGWTTELSIEERGRLYDNGLECLAALHTVDWTQDLSFLQPPGTGSPLDRFLAQVEHWYEWCAPVRRFGTDVIDGALSHVLAERPASSDGVMIWGDARPGNLIFADDLTVAAMIDWEAACVGPPEFDLAWWLMFEDFLCEGQGLRRLEGVPGRAGTIARYEELVGRPMVDVAYYQILAGLVLALINSRLAELMIESGQVDEATAAEFVTRVAGMITRYLRL
jgi:aminoglycoside phosphotransferase (APT) family kinase protein